MPPSLRLAFAGLAAFFTPFASHGETVAPLTAGSRVESRLDAKQTRAHVLAAAPGDFVQGTLDGASMRMVLLDGTGKRARVLATGKRESQDFMFVAGDKPPYSLEVRAPEAGAYALTLTELIPRAQQTAPAAAIESPRLRALAQNLAAGGTSDDFWREMQAAGGPLVEPGTAPGRLLVTFLWRGTGNSVKLFGSPSGEHELLTRLGRSDVWYRSYHMPDSARLGYKFAPDVPELNAPAGLRRRAILATAQRDPLNAKSFPPKPLDKYDGESLLELPQAPPQPWIDPRPGVAAGTVEKHRVASAILGNARDVHLYRPAGWRPGAAGNALAVLFDAEYYLSDIPSPTILDNLIAAGRLPPTAAIIIANPSRDTRTAELPPNPDFARFLAEELMPWAKAQGVAAEAARTVVSGSSFGGLASAYAGFSHPEWFGNVYSQSGSFWWAPGTEEPEWLTRQYAAAPAKPVTFYLEAGLFEGNRNNQVGILESTRHLRDVLRAKGYAVQHQEYAAGHDHLHWRGTLATGLTALLGTPDR
jgi:Enterochelin esterase and related enzymes